MFGIIETIVIVALLAAIAWRAGIVFVRARVSKRLMEDSKPYEALTTDYDKTLLILGDSTGVGTGASLPEDTVAARLGAYIGATYVENQAKNGAAVEDLSTQIQRLHLSHYDYILIQIGGNDILAFHDASKTAEKLNHLLGTLPDWENLIIMSAGNVGGATILPIFARPFYTLTTLAYHKEFSKVAKAHDATYVNLFRKPWKDPFIKEPSQYLADDGLHPSSEGYGLWFEALREEMGNLPASGAEKASK